MRQTADTHTPNLRGVAVSHNPPGPGQPPPTRRSCRRQARRRQRDAVHDPQAAGGSVTWRVVPDRDEPCAAVDHDEPDDLIDDLDQARSGHQPVAARATGRSSQPRSSAIRRTHPVVADDPSPPHQVASEGGILEVSTTRWDRSRRAAGRPPSEGGTVTLLADTTHLDVPSRSVVHPAAPLDPCLKERAVPVPPRSFDLRSRGGFQGTVGGTIVDTHEGLSGSREVTHE